MTLVIDASVGLKWVLPEAGSDRACDLAAREPLAAPDLFWVECANVLWVKWKRGQIRPEDARVAYGAIAAMPIAVLPASTLAATAQALAFELNHAAYDCLYLAAALAERTVLVTADEAFVSAVGRHGAYAGSVRLL